MLKSCSGSWWAGLSCDAVLHPLHPRVTCTPSLKEPVIEAALPEAASCPLSKQVGLYQLCDEVKVPAEGPAVSPGGWGCNCPKTPAPLLLPCLEQHTAGQVWSPPGTCGDCAHLQRGLALKRRSMELGMFTVKPSSGWAAAAVGGGCVRENITGTVSSFPRRREGKISQQAWWTLEETSSKTAVKWPVLWQWHPARSLPMRSDLWHHLGKTSEYLCRRTRVYHSFILGFPQRVTGCINSDMIPVWPGL